MRYRRNADARIRELERRVASGDQTAILPLGRELERKGRGVMLHLDVRMSWTALLIGARGPTRQEVVASMADHLMGLIEDHADRGVPNWLTDALPGVAEDLVDSWSPEAVEDIGRAEDV